MPPSPELQSFLGSLLKTAYFVGYTYAAHLAASILLADDIDVSESGRMAEARDKYERIRADSLAHFDDEGWETISHEVSVTRDVGALNHYLTQILSRVFRERPEALKTSETVEVREVLDCVDLDEFREQRAQRRVEKLSYLGLRTLLEDLETKLGLVVDIDAAALAIAVEFIEVRNILAHSDGLVTRIFLSRTEREDLTEGQRFPLTSEYYYAGNDALRNVVVAIDTKIVEHFRLS